MRSYIYHGIQIKSDFDLRLSDAQELKSQSPSFSSLTYTHAKAPSPLFAEALWVDPQRYQDGTHVAELHVVDGDPVYRVIRAGVYAVKAREIAVWPESGEDATLPLLGRCLALWLERGGVPVLHGSSISFGDGRAIGILGDSGMGKSTLSAALSNRGLQLVTDDLIPLMKEDNQISVYPGIPMSRIWPETGKWFFNDFETLTRTHPESRKRKVFKRADGGQRFCDEVHRLETIVILRRQSSSSEIALKPLGPAEALMALIRNSYQPEVIDLLGLQPKRMAILAHTVANTSIYELHYPSGREFIDSTCGALLSLEG